MLKSEMAPSVEDAVKRGDSPEDIFGPAEKWAGSRHKAYIGEQASFELWRLRLSGFAFYFLLIGTGTVGLRHLKERAASFPLDVATVGLVVFLALVVSISLSPKLNSLLLRLPGVRALRMRSEHLVLAFSLLVYSLYALAPQLLGVTGFMRWSLLDSVVLLVCAVVAGAFHFGWDLTRFRANDPEYGDLELVPTNTPSAEDFRDRMNRLALYLAAISTVCFGLLWFVIPTAGERGSLLVPLAACVCWTLFLVFSMARGRKVSDGHAR